MAGRTEAVERVEDGEVGDRLIELVEQAAQGDQSVFLSGTIDKHLLALGAEAPLGAEPFFLANRHGEAHLFAAVERRYWRKQNDVDTALGHVARKLLNRLGKGLFACSC